MSAESFSAIGMAGSIIAVLLSYSVNSSILWAIFHFFLGWIYVVYWAIEYTDLLNWIRGLIVK